MRRLSLAKSNVRIFGWFVLAAYALCSLPLAAQENASPTPSVSEAVRFAVSPPLRELAKLPRQPQYGLHEVLPVRRIPKRAFGVAVDPVEQNTFVGPPSTDYSIGLDFLGVGNGFPGYSVPDAPPDTNLAVGDTQILQWVNVSFAVFNKFNRAVEAGPIDGNLLFTALGGPCAANNDGDIIAQWDNAAHRWLLAQNVFVSPYYVCVAVSSSADALGTYYLYQFSVPGNGFPDYPKWGRWNTTWAQTMNNFGPGGSGFQGPQVCLYERAKLLAGTSARQVCFQLASDGDSLLPADIDSPTSPPSSECQFYIGSVADVSTHQLSLYSTCIDWLHPSLAYLTGNHNSQLITVPTYTGSCGGNFGGDCVPQKGITDELDSLGDRLMYRFAYYNDPVGGGGPKQHWYVNHDVEASGGQIGVRWYEFQAPQIAIIPNGMTLFQSGTYSPDSNYRWMGSMAADRNNDILVGYSLSSSTVFPSIEVAGRLKSSPAGTLEPEVSVVAGTGSQPDTSNRWGDYSAMRIDPDGCTFWYTTEYYLLTQRFDWSTQIANVKFANCHNPAYDGYIELCKQSDPDNPVTGTFNFTLTAPFFSYGPVGVPVGTCSAPIEVPSGVLTVNEAPQVGVAVENVTAYSYDQYGNYIDELDTWTPPQQTATVTVMPGGVNLETVATFTNYAAPPGALKVCKIAGSNSLIGQLFSFTATGLPPFQVQAGPPPGSCQIVGTLPVNSQTTVAEIVPPGVSVQSITVNPPNRGGAQTANSVIVTIGSGITEVDFTDVVGVPVGSCQASSSLSVLLLQGNNVIAYVPRGRWKNYCNPSKTCVIQGNTGVTVANIEGSAISPVTLPTADYINSCASEPTLTPPQTVCTANNNHVYVFDNTPSLLYTPFPSAGVGEIGFSGGYCTNCGIAMDAVHHKAVVGLSLSGGAGFQFLDLFNYPTPPSFEPNGFVSNAGQISEDLLIDPISTPPLLLSATESGQYEIVDITDTRNPVSYENNIHPPGTPDSSGEDCSTGIALAPLEFTTDSILYLADLNQATFTYPNWTDPFSQFQTLTESNLANDASGIAVAQGTHTGVVSEEYGGDSLTAIQLPATSGTGTGIPAVQDWVTCEIGQNFINGYDPHTVTAYTSLGGGGFPAGDAIAVLANSDASKLAVVDLTLMLSSVPRTTAGHACLTPPLPSTVVIVKNIP